MSEKPQVSSSLALQPAGTVQASFRTAAATGADGAGAFGRRTPRQPRPESPSGPCRSSENLFHDMAVDVGQPLLAPAEVVGELLMVKAEKMEEGSVQVVDGHGILRHLVP